MNRYAHAIYCDDVRQEAGGKQSFIGVYRGQLQLRPIPTVLPRLCVVVDVVTPMSAPFERLLFEVMLGEQRLANSVLAGDDLMALYASAPKFGNPPDPQARFTFSANFVFSPLRIERPAVLGVRVDTGAGVLHANTLQVIALAEPPAAPRAGEPRRVN